MSIAEIKREAESLSLEEKRELAAYLKHLARRDDPANQAELDRVMREMDQGVKFTAQDLEKLRATRSGRA